MINMKEATNILNSTLNTDDTIIVACSAGPDSMCLLSLVMQLNKKLNIVVAHVNHSVRLQSNEEYKYLENYCLNNQLIFEGIVLNKLSTKNFEAEARKKRYEFFKKLKNKYNAKYILTAHHGDDLIETILMRITRGSNLSGYAGIKVLDNDYFRPLLYTNKDEIIAYLTKNNIHYYIDVTNNEDNHTRNRYRHNIIPFLKNESSNIYDKYLQYSKELQDYDNFVKEYIKNKQIINKNIIDINSLKEESDFIKKKALELLIIEYQKNDLLDINNKALTQAVSLINSDKPNGFINLNNGYKIAKDYNKIYIEKIKKLSENFNQIFNGSFENDDWLIRQDDSNSTNNFTIRLNSNELKLPLIIRNRVNGDAIELKNSGHKKVKDIFIDEKINLTDRNTWPIVTDSNGIILWIPGLKKSKFDNNINEKYDIILTCERKKKNE